MASSLIVPRVQRLVSLCAKTSKQVQGGQSRAHHLAVQIEPVYGCENPNVPVGTQRIMKKAPETRSEADLFHVFSDRGRRIPRRCRRRSPRFAPARSRCRMNWF